MSMISKGSKTAILLAMLALPATASVAMQQETAADDDVLTTVIGTIPTEGPEIKGVITAREGDQMKVTSEDGITSTVTLRDETEIRATGGFLGLGRDQLNANSLLNGLPVTIETLQAGEQLFADRIKFRSKDLRTAAMIRNATAQQFAEQGAAIDDNTAGIGENAEGISANALATEALRGRMGDIDKYNLMSTTNVFFDSGRTNLSARAKSDLCVAAEDAEELDNALLLVVGYTDSTGSYEINQELSEKRAGRVVNHLQQVCGWKPYRMLSPTGMAASDPLASNDTEAGKAQNRRVSVNVLVSKSLEGL